MTKKEEENLMRNLKRKNKGFSFELGPIYALIFYITLCVGFLLGLVHWIALASISVIVFLLIVI